MNRPFLENWSLGGAGVLLGALCTSAGFLLSKLEGSWVLVVIVPLLALTAASLWLQWKLAGSRETRLMPDSVESEPPVSAAASGSAARGSSSVSPGARAAMVEAVPETTRPEAPAAPFERLQEEQTSAPPIPDTLPSPLPIEMEGLLSETWETYFLHGEGRLTPEGLQRRLRDHGVEARVIPGEEAGTMDGLFLVLPRDGGDKVYLLPDFNKTIRSVGEWFAAPRADSRLARIQRVVCPAVGRKTREGFEKIKQGTVE